MSPVRRRVVAPTAVAVGTIAVLVLAACSSDADQHSAGNYCTQVGDHLDDLEKPDLTTQADIDAMLDTWRAVAATAPLAIEREWSSLVTSMETASTVDPNDPESVKLALDTAREAEGEANAIIDYTYRTCNAVIGDVTPATIPPASSTPTTGDTGGTPPVDTGSGATSTTAAPPATDAGASTPTTGG